jgi:hypothetical protein
MTYAFDEGMGLFCVQKKEARVPAMQRIGAKRWMMVGF